jgi:hypothetical protein
MFLARIDLDLVGFVAQRAAAQFVFEFIVGVAIRHQTRRLAVYAWEVAARRAGFARRCGRLLGLILVRAGCACVAQVGPSSLIRVRPFRTGVAVL